MSKILNATFCDSIPWQDKPEKCFLPVWRYTNNPVIGRNVNQVIERAFNSAFVYKDGSFIGVFRGEMYNGMPTLFLGRSKDGIHFELDEERIRFVDEKGNPLPEKAWAYDPRVIELDGEYYVVWADLWADVTIGIAKTKDFKTFVKLPYGFLPNIRNGSLFPRKINGKYMMLSRPSDNSSTMFGNIFLSDSPDLKYWGNHRLLLQPNWVWWCGIKVGPGPAPIETDEGWLVFIHGVNKNCNNLVYNMGAMLLDRNDPSKVLGVCDDVLLTPQEDYEVTGFTPNVVFPTCVIPASDGRLAIYYGAADTFTCLAFTTVDTILDHIKKHPAKKAGYC